MKKSPWRLMIEDREALGRAFWWRMAKHFALGAVCAFFLLLIVVQCLCIFGNNPERMEEEFRSFNQGQLLLLAGVALLIGIIVAITLSDEPLEED